jgi:Tfp pilus assembly PilM family ATPase
MAKVPNSVVGVDLGRHAFKSVLIQRRGGNRFQLTNYAVQDVEGIAETPEQIAEQLKLLFKHMGGSAKASSVAVTVPDALIRIIEQPSTPCDILRDALRINGYSLLNQDCRDFVLDCDEISKAVKNGDVKKAAPVPGAPSPRAKYLVGGLPRKNVMQIDSLFQKNSSPLKSIQLAPICVFNAFEFSNEEVFKNEAFLLVDIGHLSSTVIVGLCGELVLVRSLEYGGKALVDGLMSNGGSNRESVLSLLEEGDDLLLETARLSLTALTREISSSIGFFEGQHEHNIPRIFVTGGASASKAILQILAEDLRMPCQAWSPFLKCDIGLSGTQKANFARDITSLNVACGAAIEFLKTK